MNTVGWFEIYVDNMDRAKKFYEAVFLKKLEKLETPNSVDAELWSFPGDMENYGANGALVKMPGFPTGQNSVIIYFSCENCKTEEKRASESGGKVFKTKFSIGQYGFISLVEDTEGNMIGLHSLQ